MAVSRVLVTGGSGYLASHVIAALLREGRRVRTTARTLDREPSIREAIDRAGVDGSGLQVVAADLTADDGWAAAVEGCAEIHHVASPLPASQPDDPDELVAPARDGALRVLRAARTSGARRVVLTSSFAAVGYTPKPGSEFTEADWTDPDTPGLAAYPKSKTIAERAAWDFVADGGPDLVTVNPTAIFGPALSTTPGASLQLIKSMLDGTMTVAPRQRFGIVDVRDVADLHLLAMAEPSASGRYLAVAHGPTLSLLEIAQTLRHAVPELATRVPTTEEDGPVLPRPVIYNDRARSLGWRPRPPQQTLVDTANSLRDLGVLAESG